MENQKHITGFFIDYYGDRSVGLFSASWALSGDFWLTDEELKEFKASLIASFEIVSDTPLAIETFEERGIRLKREESHLVQDEYMNTNYPQNP